MLNLFRMDLRRLLRGKALYILIGVLTVVVLSSVLMAGESANITDMLGASSGGMFDMEGGGGFGSGMGLSIIYGLLGLIAMLFICNDYSSGFAKNIFTVHVSKRNYIVSKLLTMMVAAAIMIGTFLVELFILCLLTGKGVIIDNPLGLVMFIFQKWLISGAFAAVYIFINLLTRSKAVGSIMAFLIGMGGLVMGLQLFFGMIGIDGAVITESTIYGASNLAGLEFDALTLLRVFGVAAAWTVVYGFLSQKVLVAKDV